MSLWRNSASLILAVRNSVKPSHIGATNYDYNILSLKRHKKSSFMPGAYVFPGGMVENADSDLKWKKLYSDFGFNEESYQSLIPKTNSRPPIFSSSSGELPREISLRISVIRETFEECGILLCKKKCEDKVHWASHLSLTENDVKVWQSKVQSNATNFYKMCQQFQCYPDLWSLHEWSDWLTPTSLGKKRYEAVFFLAGMDALPETICSVEEVEEVKWETPSNLITSFHFLLPPPQHYELNRIAQFDNLSKLIHFAVDRSKCGINLYLPVKAILQDGFVLLLPGDSSYPTDASKTEDQLLDKSEITILKFRELSEALNRIEINIEDRRKYIICNCKCNDGHLIHQSDVKQLGNDETLTSKL